MSKSIIDRSSRLLLIAGGVPIKDEAWLFFTPNGTVKIQGHNHHLKKLLPFFDGTKTLMQIQTYTHEVEGKALNGLIEELYGEEIIVDCNKLYNGFLPYLSSNNRYRKKNTFEELDRAYSTSSLPPINNTITPINNIPLTPLSAALGARQTSYEYSPTPLSYNYIGGLFWHMYGQQAHLDRRLAKDRYTVPSGGAMYTLRFDIFILKENSELTMGHYLWRPDGPGFEKIHDAESLCLDSVYKGNNVNIKDATAIFIISSHLDKAAQKYGTVALPLAYIEAGHAFQNGYIYASQQNFAIAQIYGFDRAYIEPYVSQQKGQYVPLTSGIIGHKI